MQGHISVPTTLNIQSVGSVYFRYIPVPGPFKMAEQYLRLVSVSTRMIESGVS